MPFNDLIDQPPHVSSSTSLASRLLLIAFCLAAGLAYRTLVGVVPASLLQAAMLAGLAALFFVLAVLARRTATLRAYWDIPFAFFIFTVAGLCGDQGGFMQHLLVRNVFHETPSTNNPLASTVMGSVVAQIVSTVCLVLPIIFLTRASARLYPFDGQNMNGRVRSSHLIRTRKGVTCGT